MNIVTKALLPILLLLFTAQTSAMCVTNKAGIEKLRGYYKCDGSLFGCSRAQLLPLDKETCWAESTGILSLLKVENDKCSDFSINDPNAKIDIVKNEDGNVVCKLRVEKSKDAVVVNAKGDPILSEEAALVHNVITVHYWREDNNYEGWGLHLWGDGVVLPTEESEPLEFYEPNDFGMSLGFQVTKEATSSDVRFFIHNGEDRDISHNREFPFYEKLEFWLIQGDPQVYQEKADADAAKEFILEFADF